MVRTEVLDGVDIKLFHGRYQETTPIPIVPNSHKRPASARLLLLQLAHRLLHSILSPFGDDWCLPANNEPGSFTTRPIPGM